MHTRVKLAVKRSEMRGGNPVSQMQNTGISSPLTSPIDHIFFLQKTLGNHAVQRLFKCGAIQAKLKVGQAGDIWEQEADRVAEQVMRISESACPESKEEEKELIRPKEISCKSPATIPHLESRINNSKSGGHLLPKSTHTYFEPIFGQNFSQVQVHTGSNAAQMSRELNTQAFTVGREIYFGTGRYSPGISSGRRLLSYELPDIVHQDTGTMSIVMRKPDRDQSSVQSYFHDLNGRSMADMLRVLLESGADIVTEMYGHLHEARGVYVAKIRIAMLAVLMSGDPLRFALTYQSLIEPLPLDQRLELLRVVGGSGWNPPQVAEPGDKIMPNAVLYPTEIRVRTSPALTWQSNNPGALTYMTGQYGFYVLDFGAYQGKRNGILSIFPTQTAGYLALLHWMNIHAKQSIIGFTRKHAPRSHGGNRPKEYAEYIAMKCGLGVTSIYSVKIGSLSQPCVADAIMSQEGWSEGRVLSWDDPELPPEVRFRLMYTRWVLDMKRSE